MRSLLVSLGEHSLAMLRGIADLRGVTLTSNLRDEAASQLAAALADEASTGQAISSASPEAQLAWVAIQGAGGKMKTATFARQFGEIRPMGPGRLERELVWRTPENAAEELWYRGLIFRAFADFGDGPMEYIYIPEDLPVPPLEQPTAPGPRGVPLQPANPPHRSRHALNSLAVDACIMLASVRENGLTVDDKGAAEPVRAAELREGLLLPDASRFELLLAMSLITGWLAPDRGRLVVDHERVGSWLRLSHWEQMSLLFSAWREAVAWNDLRHTPGLVAEGEWRNDPALARRRLLRLLRRLDGKTWYRVADVAALMKRADPDFQRPDGNYSGWYLREAATQRYLSGFESWDAVEGRLLRFLLEGPLFWLGAVAASDGSADERTFRLTPAGAAWLAARMPRDPPQPARLSVSEDFTVTAPLLLPLLDRYRLVRFTEWVTGERWELRRETFIPAATKHRISRASLARAREAGLKAEDAVAFLRRAAAGRVPPRVIAAIERYGQLGGQVRLTRGAVLRVTDANVLATLRADPLIAPLLGDLLSAQSAIIPDANVERLLAILKDSGYAVDPG